MSPSSRVTSLSTGDSRYELSSAQTPSPRTKAGVKMAMITKAMAAWMASVQMVHER